MKELDSKKNILLKNRPYILRMPNNKKKVEMLKAYYSLLHYYQVVTHKDEIMDLDIDDEFSLKYDKYIIKDTAKNIDEVEKNAGTLCEKFGQIIDSYKENDFCLYEYIKMQKVDATKMDEALYNFFATLGDDVLKIYCNMALNQNIYLYSESTDRLGYSLDSTPIDHACITMQNIPHYLDFYVTLAHEVGHCYQFYLQKSQKNYGMFDPYCEITSMLFEKLFTEYLKNNCLIKKSLALDLEHNLSLLNNISISKVLCELLRDGKIGAINPFNLSYTSSVKEEDLKKEIINNCGYIKPYYLTPDFTEMHYSFGEIISKHFVERLQSDFDTEWDNFKNFICTVNYLPMEEVIDTYFDIDLIKNDVKKLTKSYRER